MSEKLKRLETAMKAAHRALDTALLDAYPKGREIGVLLNCKQTNPTWATVVGVGWRGGYIRVMLVKPNRRGRHKVYDVHFSQVAVD